MGRLEVFKKELEYIKDESIRNFTEQTILKLPDYFFEMGASSSGKYHPKFCLGEGGLVKHVKVAVTIAMDLMQLEMMNSYTDVERDIVISSLLLHDGLKKGLGDCKYTVTEHPLLIAQFVNEDSELSNILDKGVLKLITGCLQSHMGQWVTDYKTKRDILPKPKGKLQNFVHLCDYLGSRKYFEEFDFTVNVIRK